MGYRHRRWLDFGWRRLAGRCAHGFRLLGSRFASDGPRVVAWFQPVTATGSSPSGLTPASTRPPPAPAPTAPPTPTAPIPTPPLPAPSPRPLPPPSIGPPAWPGAGKGIGIGTGIGNGVGAGAGRSTNDAPVSAPGALVTAPAGITGVRIAAAVASDTAAGHARASRRRLGMDDVHLALSIRLASSPAEPRLSSYRG